MPQITDRYPFTFIHKGNCPLLSNNVDDYPEGIVILVDKPYKWTSADVVRKVKFKLQHYFNKKNIKVGHAGTLDPLATGVLVICIGKATKISESLQMQEKEYIAQICFGATTPCFDMEKEIDCTYKYDHITIERIQETLPSFLGEQQQVPPIYSAKLVEGVRAYDFARQGEEVELKSSTINIYEMEILKFESPFLTLRIRCSKGTYIRALARDLGVALESGAYLTSLVRSASGDFNISNALSLEEIVKLLQER